MILETNLFLIVI